MTTNLLQVQRMALESPRVWLSATCCCARPSDICSAHAKPHRRLITACRLLMQLLRSQAPAERRERAHLLYLYDALVGCVLCREPRVRQQLHAVLQLAGAELGLAPSA